MAKRNTSGGTAAPEGQEESGAAGRILEDYLADSGAVYKLRGERGIVGRLARNLAGRGLAETRRAALGMQLRLTLAGDALADERERATERVWAETDWSGIPDGLMVRVFHAFRLIAAPEPLPQWSFFPNLDILRA